MKKIIGLSLIAALLLLSLVGCFPIGGPTPANTTANTTIAGTTAAPVTTETPTEPTLQLKKISYPATSSDEYQTWYSSLNLPAEPPATEILYEILAGSDQASTLSCKFQATVMIQNQEELTGFFLDENGYPNEEGSQALYEQLCQVDFSQKALLFVSVTRDGFPILTLNRIVKHEESLIVFYDSNLQGSAWSDAYATGCHIVLVDRAALPVTDGMLEIYYCVEHPNDSSLPGYPNVTCPDARYVFEPTAK